MSSFKKIIQQLSQIPGIGTKSAQRMTFHFLKMPKDKALSLTQNINDFVNKTIFCKVCGLISEQNPCKICKSPQRDTSVICIVKNIEDAILIEKSKNFKGLYHVLPGFLSPLHNINEEDMKVEKLLERITPSTQEIIFAFEQTIESDATVSFIRKKLVGVTQLSFSKIAVGIPIGTGLEYIDDHTLKQSFNHRLKI